MRPRKIDDDEMLINHQPPDAAQMAERQDPVSESVIDPKVEIKALTARLAATADPAERQAVIAEIQERVGNQEAERIVRSVQRVEDE